jgi:hypothetical protein
MEIQYQKKLLKTTKKLLKIYIEDAATFEAKLIAIHEVALHRNS